MLGSIFVALLGLFLYRYEQLNRFVVIPRQNSIYIVDRKNNRITRLDNKGPKVILKGDESFLYDRNVDSYRPKETLDDGFGNAFGGAFAEELPVPAAPLSEPPLPIEVPQTKASQDEIAVEAYEREQAKVAASRRTIPSSFPDPTPDAQQAPKSSSTFIDQAAGAAESAAKNVLRDPNTYKALIREGEKKLEGGNDEKQ